MRRSDLRRSEAKRRLRALDALPPVAIAGLWAVLGAALTVAVCAIAIGSTDAEHLLIPLAIASVATIAVIALAARWLAKASLKLRFLSISGVAVLIGLVNLAVLSRLMLVSQQDAELIAVLLIYATGVALGCGLAAGRASARAIERVAATAELMAGGDLAARAGRVGGGRELERLASTLDQMASRLDLAQRHERSIEGQRRDLIVAVSHDLRTPLADVQAMAEAIEDEVVSDPETVRLYASRMGASVESLARLVDDLFEFVQLEGDAIEAEREVARVGQVVDWAVAACDGQATIKGLSLQTDLGELASAECSPRLTRVLQNLLQNAIRHTPEDGTIRVCARHAGTALELAVEDTGEGIEAEPIERVFEPFWRGDAARASEGSGLGLALAKRIVESLGGTIAVESAAPRGARFAVVVPQAE